MALPPSVTGSTHEIAAELVVMLLATTLGTTPGAVATAPFAEHKPTALDINAVLQEHSKCKYPARWSSQRCRSLRQTCSRSHPPDSGTRYRWPTRTGRSRNGNRFLFLGLPNRYPGEPSGSVSFGPRMLKEDVLAVIVYLAVGARVESQLGSHTIDKHLH